MFVYITSYANKKIIIAKECKCYEFTLLFVFSTVQCATW